MIISKSIPSSKWSKQIIEFKCDDCGKLNKRRFDGLSKNKLHRCRPCATKYNGLLKKGIKRDKKTIAKIKKTRAKTISQKYPKFEIECKYCNKSFTVPYRHRDRLYCSRSCQSKSIIKSDIRKVSKCLICKKEFKHYGERSFCSRICTATYLSITRFGENNPCYKPKQKQKCLYCNKIFEYNRGGMQKQQKRVFCSLACSHQISTINCPSNKKNGYPTIFNNKLKELVKSRDNYLCQLCGIKENKPKHHIHHIDYDKKNCDINNLITLCKKCHNMTHSGRTFWEIIFSGLISGSKMVKKEWGIEIHIANHNDYCLKYLVFFKNYQFSYHTHKLKKELWHCVYGKFECVLGNKKNKDYLIFNQGDKLELERNTPHQLQALKNSILVEISTRSYKEDYIRLIQAIN